MDRKEAEKFALEEVADEFEEMSREALEISKGLRDGSISTKRMGDLVESMKVRNLRIGKIKSYLRSIK